MIRYRLLLFILLGSLLSGCQNNTSNSKKIKEGTITYKVHYLADEKENPMITLLPSTMDLKFKSNNISLISVGYLGFFSTRFISSYKGEESHLLLKILNNRFDYAFPREEIAFIYQNLPNTHIEYRDSVKNIAGFDCKMAIIHCPDSDLEDIKVFYTNEINLKDPNRNTPFKDLKGVLMEFETKMHNIGTRFEAVSVLQEEVPDEEFMIPDDYKLVSQEEIKKFLLDFN